MSSVVAVAGGTGKLGRTIVETLVDSGKFQVFVLAREVCGPPIQTQSANFDRFVVDQ